MTVSEAMLGTLRTFAADRLWYAVYSSASHEVRTALTGVSVTTNGKIEAQFEINAEELGGERVTQVGIYDRNGELWGSEETGIDPNAAGEGTILYQFLFTIEAKAE